MGDMMRKVLLVGVGTLAVVVVAVLCISWFVQSSELKKHVEESIAAINTNQNSFTYERIEVSGFPTQIALRIVNPHFSGRIGQLPENALNATNSAAALPDWHEDIALNGAITFTVNALSTHYTLGTTGKWQKSGKLAGKDLPTIGNNAETENLCSLKLARSGLFSNFWNYKITEENAAQLLKEIREVDCNSPAYTITDMQTGKALFNSGPTRLFFSSEPAGAEQSLRLFMKSSGAEITPEGEKFITSYVIALSPDYPFPPLFSVYGKQNIDFDLTYKGPLDITSNSRNVDIHLNAMNITNDVYTTKGYLHFINQQSGSERNASLNMRFDSVYTELYDMMLKDTVRNIIRHAANSNDPEFRKIKEILINRTPEESFALVQPAIPKMHTFGNQVMALNASFAGKNDFMNGDYKITELAITAAPYGITGTGIQSFSAEPPPFFISPSLIEGTKKFFYVLSGSSPEEKQNGRFSYAIVSDPSGGVTISGRSLGDIMAMYNEYIGETVEAPPESIPPQGWKVN